VLVGVVCIGFSAIFTRLADAPGVVSAFYRVLIASAALVPLWLLRGSPLPDRRTILLSLAAGVLFGIDLSLWNVSLFLTNAANATWPRSGSASAPCSFSKRDSDVLTGRGPFSRWSG
jgi:drug/metabolite transporter (DMT)-like permease